MGSQQVATVSQLRDFDEIIDVRSPGEFALDHVPSALNCPVLNDAERARVGYVYKQESTFAAKRIGAALVARNIAQHIEQTFAQRPRHWRPLIYCWRGGGRSEAMCDMLRRIGWQAVRLEGGYQAFRRNVTSELAVIAPRHRYFVICGKTGSAKSKVLSELARLGTQVLDLERLACHRGSVLGEIPGATQPSQKMFESRLHDALSRFDPNRPVFVEAESRKVGNVQIPEALINVMRTAACIVLDVPGSVRGAFLLQEYSHFLEDTEGLCGRLDALSSHYGQATIERWKDLARNRAHARLVDELLIRHYDPAYERSAARNFRTLAAAPVVPLLSSDDVALREAAARIASKCQLDYGQMP